MQYSVQDFIQCLDDHRTATQALNTWCTSHRIPGASGIHAHILQDTPIAHERYDGPLSLRTGETLQHRRVCLNWGDTTMSEADNWYLPDRLPEAMRDRLENTTVPFGQVVMELGPVRKLLSRTPVAQDEQGRFILLVSAVLETADGTLIAEVREHYCRSLLEFR